LAESGANIDDSMANINLSGSIDQARLNKCLLPQLRSLSSSVLLDLTDVQFMDLHSAMLILAVLSRLGAKERLVTLRLPVKSDVCHFLAAWEFIPALEEVLGRTAQSFLTNDQLQLLRDAADPTKNPYMDARLDRDGALQRLYSSKFFSLQSFNRQSSLFSASLAADVARNWRQVMIEHVLQRMLPKGVELFRSRIVFEAMMNAIRHPQANLILTASIIRRERSGHRFCVGFWDNGSLIPSTLRRALRKGLSIKGEAFSTVECEYIVYEGAEGHRCGSVLPTKVPDKDTSDAGLLLASLFPGITCDPFGLTRPPDTPTPPGMGLYFITNAAVTVFGGRINLRCGREELQVSRPKRERPLGRETFNVRLRTHPMSVVSG